MKPHLGVGRPLQLQAQQGDLGRGIEEELLEGELVDVAGGALDDGLHGPLHPVHQPLHPALHHACSKTMQGLGFRI